MKTFSIIVAMDEACGIGRQGALAWHLREDLKHFKEITVGTRTPSKCNAVVMGRKTWESLPEKFRPLPNRLNVVLTSSNDLSLPKGVLSFSGLNSVLEYMARQESIENVFVIGGAQIFVQAIGHPACRCIFATHVEGNFSCDVFFPSIPACFKPVVTGPRMASREGMMYHFIEYKVE